MLPVTWTETFVRKRMQRSCVNLMLTFLLFVIILVLRDALDNSRSEDGSVEHLDGLNHEHKRSFIPAFVRPSSSNSALAETKQDVDLDSVEAGVEAEEFPEPDSDSTLPYSLGLEIKDWDKQRAAWLQDNTHMKIPKDGQPRILLVTGSQPKPCDNPMGDHYNLKSLKNKIDYCRLHNIEIFYNIAQLDQEMAGFWSKLPLLRKLMLAHPEVEWMWWMDSDAMFTDMLFEVPLEKYRNYSMVLHGWDEMVYIKKNWVGLNTGSFLLRNNQWSLDLLDIWATMGSKGAIRDEAGKLLTANLVGRPVFEADDQSALIYLLGTRESELRPHVYLEDAYYLHGYWALFVEKYEEMMEKYHPGLGDDRWPFVTHFVGCKPCDTYGSYEKERCLTQMERAFNFADNQILNHYGLKHRALSTPKIERIRNDSSTPLEFLHQTFPTPGRASSTIDAWERIRSLATTCT